MVPPKCRALCVDDNKDTCELVAFILSQQGCEVVAVLTPEEALSLSERERFDLLILDYHFHGMTGVEACREIRRRGEKTPVIFFTGEAHDSERQAALAAGAQAYLVKPGDIEILAETAERLMADADDSRRGGTHDVSR